MILWSFPALASARLTIEGKGFTIQPPEGWAVKVNELGASLFFEAPSDAKDRYKRNIRIMAFTGHRFLDMTSYTQFAETIRENSSKISNALKEYEIRDLTEVELENGVKAGLFYADFTANEVPMMQMHILVSNKKHHFLMTYTDIRSRFEETSNGMLDEAYNSFKSVSLDSQPPGRNDFIMLIVGVSLSFIAVVLFVGVVRRRMVKNLEKGIDEFDDSTESSWDGEEELAETEPESDLVSHYDEDEDSEDHDDEIEPFPESFHGEAK